MWSEAGPGCGRGGNAGACPDEVHLLLINDTYRSRATHRPTVGSRWSGPRAELERQHGEVLVLHAGDFLFPSLLSRTYKGAQMVDVLGLLDGDAEAADERLLVTFGNHEFDKGRAKHALLLLARIDESAFRWVVPTRLGRRGGWPR